MKRTNWHRIKCYVKFSVALFVILAACVFCLYPAGVVARLLLDAELRQTGLSSALPDWFEATSARHADWAEAFLDSGKAAKVNHWEVAATEWPMFGSVFYLVTAQELHDRGLVDATRGVIRDAVELSAEIVASPETATWVRTKWGDDYLERENCFYRMLLVKGLAAHQSIIGSGRHDELLVQQTHLLAAEIAAAPLHLIDDYPYECYPNDILWAVAAIQRSGHLRGEDYTDLIRSFMDTFNGPKITVNGLPAYQMNSQQGYILQLPRGCGNSGILQFAAELDPEIAQSWYAAYARDFWKDNGWLAGFTEVPVGSKDSVMDVDSGPVALEFGSVASAFGIGAAISVGRLDHSVPLTLEAVACSWPTPWGFMIPKLMGMAEVDSPTLGEVALLFSMSRPSQIDKVVPYSGNVPGIVWIMLAAYSGVGTMFIVLEIRGMRRALKRYRTGMV